MDCVLLGRLKLYRFGCHSSYKCLPKACMRNLAGAHRPTARTATNMGPHRLMFRYAGSTW